MTAFSAVVAFSALEARAALRAALLAMRSSLAFLARLVFTCAAAHCRCTRYLGVISMAMTSPTPAFFGGLVLLLRDDFLRTALLLLVLRGLASVASARKSFGLVTVVTAGTAGAAVPVRGERAVEFMAFESLDGEGTTGCWKPCSEERFWMGISRVDVLANFPWMELSILSAEERLTMTEYILYGSG